MVAPFINQAGHGFEPMAAQTDILGEGSLVQMDVFETESEVVVEIDLPGVDPSKINVLAQGGWLIVEGVKSDLDPPKEQVGYLCVERYFGSVKRTVKLPGGVDPSAIRAVYRRGVLRITLPRTGPADASGPRVVNDR